MATLADRVYDNGLTVLDTEANRVDICSQEPTTYAQATSTYTLGNETTITISAPTDGDTSGRKVTLSAISGASVTATGTATHYAITDTSNSRLLATGSISPSQAVTSGNTFSLTAVDIEIPDPA
jgi:hypothetical protein